MPQICDTDIDHACHGGDVVMVVKETVVVVVVKETVVVVVVVSGSYRGSGGGTA